MTAPYRDPDGPIHAVLAAANTVAPRCHLPDGVSLVHARYVYPSRLPDKVGEAEGRITAQVAKTWFENVQDAIIEPDDEDDDQWFAHWVRQCRERQQRIDEAKRRTRRDVAGVIT